jgi:hypothetical protein
MANAEEAVGAELVVNGFVSQWEVAKRVVQSARLMACLEYLPHTRPQL